jgi:hypothetical protein
LVLGEETELAKCPDWYALMRAADKLNCTPWELLEVSIYWKQKALKAITAENQAKKILEERQ